MNDDIQQSLMNSDVAVIANKPKPPKAVHKVADARSRSPYHLRESVLADLRPNCARIRLIAVARHLN